jgi:hypothetical protein
MGEDAKAAYYERQRWYRMRAKFGLEREDYERMLAEQGGICPCGASPENERYSTLSVDHDRRCCPENKSCGRCLRGLLCNDCNVSLGRLKDDPNRLDILAAYLRRYESLKREKQPA